MISSIKPYLNITASKSWLLVIFLFCSFNLFAQSYTYEKAMEDFKAEKYDEAIDLFTREIGDNPKNMDAYFYRALSYYNIDKNSFALSDINYALKNYSKKDKISLAACHSLRAKIFLSIDEQDKAIEEYGAAIKMTPTYKPYYISRAQIFYDLGQFDKSEADYKTVIGMDEGDVQALTSLARNYIETKQYVEAEKILNKVIKLNADYPSGYFFRSNLYYLQKKYDAAILDALNAFVASEYEKGYREAFLEYAMMNMTLALSKVSAKIAEKPEQDDWYFVRAQLYENKKDYMSAIADYNKLMDLIDASYRSNILSYRAECYSKEEFYDQAIQDYDVIIADDSTDSYYYASRGYVKKRKGDYKAAIADFSKAISLKPDQSWYFYSRGLLKEKFLSDTMGALQDYSEAIAISSDYVYAYLHRGKLFREKLKDEKKAIADFTAIVNIDTTIDKSGNSKYYALFHLGRNKEAIDWLNKCLEQHPTESNYYDAACLYSLMNMQDKSIEALQLAFENGYRDFVHLSNDDDLNNIRNNPSYTKLLTEWRSKYESDKSKQPLVVQKAEVQKYQTTTIPMKSRGSGTYEVSCKVNDLKLSFIFDTGASDISISQTEALFMLKNGYLSDSDIRGKEEFMDANGDISVGTKIVLKKVEIGDIVLKNVSASVVNNKNAPLLFGQSALSKYGKIVIDNKKSEITISVPEISGK